MFGYGLFCEKVSTTRIRYQRRIFGFFLRSTTRSSVAAVVYSIIIILQLITRWLTCVHSTHPRPPSTIYTTILYDADSGTHVIFAIKSSPKRLQLRPLWVRDAASAQWKNSNGNRYQRFRDNRKRGCDEWNQEKNCTEINNAHFAFDYIELRT